MQYFSDFRGLTDPALWKASADSSERDTEANVKHATVNLGGGKERGVTATTCNDPWESACYAEMTRDPSALTLEDYKTVFHTGSGRTGLQLYLTEALPAKYTVMRHLSSLQIGDACPCCAGKAWMHLVEHYASNKGCEMTDGDPEAWPTEKMQYIFGGSANGAPVSMSWKGKKQGVSGGKGFGGANSSFGACSSSAGNEGRSSFSFAKSSPGSGKRAQKGRLPKHGNVGE